MGSPSRGGDVTVYVYDINHPSLPTPFYSVLVPISVFMAFSTVFHSTNSPDNSLLIFFFFLLNSPRVVFALLVISTIICLFQDSLLQP